MTFWSHLPLKTTHSGRRSEIPTFLPGISRHFDRKTRASTASEPLARAGFVPSDLGPFPGCVCDAARAKKPLFFSAVSSEPTGKTSDSNDKIKAAGLIRSRFQPKTFWKTQENVEEGKVKPHHFTLPRRRQGRPVLAASWKKPRIDLHRHPKGADRGSKELQSQRNTRCQSRLSASPQTDEEEEEPLLGSG